MPRFLFTALFLLLQLQGLSQNISATFCVFSPKNISKNQAFEAKFFENTHLVSSQRRDYSNNCLSLKLKPKGNYSLVIESSCCSIKKVDWLADTIRTPSVSFDILLDEKVIALQEVEVKANISRYHQRGDTLLIKVDDVENRPHADASSLFEHIAGLNIGLGGNVSVLGKNVQEITIDGKRIFGGVPILALNNIRADMIKRMEFIEKKLPNGESIKQLNLKLKENRKKGIYGDVAAGLSLYKDCIAEYRFNKLLENGFLNHFATANNINQPALNDKDLQRITYHSFQNNINSNGSVIGLYENSLNQAESQKEDIQADLKGINQFKSTGFNLSKTYKKHEFDTFIIYDNSTQQIYTDDNNISELGDYTQQRRSKKGDKNVFGKLSAVSEGKIAIKNKSTVYFSNQFGFAQGIKKSDEEIDTQYNVQILNYLLDKQVEEKFDKVSNSFQSAWIKKGKKKGENFSFSYQHEIALPYSQKMALFKINQRRENQFGINTQEKYFNNCLQATKSLPITKRLLFESKIKGGFNNYSLSQTGNFSAKGQVRSSETEVGAYLLYQQKRWSFVTGLMYWSWVSERTYAKQINKQREDWIYPQLAKLHFRLPSAELNIGYTSKQEMPSNQQIITVLDSSQVESIDIGNIALNPYLREKLAFSLNKNLGNNIHFDIAINKSFFRGIINHTILQQNGFLLNQSINNPKKANETSVNFSVFQVPTQSPISWAIFGIFLQNNSYFKIDSELQPLKTNAFILNQNLKWKITKTMPFNVDIQAQSYKNNQNRHTWNMQVQTKTQYGLNRTYYFDFQSRLIFNKNNAIQAFVDFSVSRYFLHNKGLNIALVCKNLFDKRFEVQTYQSYNQQQEIRINTLPQIALIKISLYPESWK